MKKFMLSVYINCIKNCIMKKKRICQAPRTKQTEKITKILLIKSYISKYFIKDNKINILLKKKVFFNIKLMSKPGFRVFLKNREILKKMKEKKYEDIIFSSNLGILSLKKMLKEKIGGEPLFYINKCQRIL
ncbi:30S ribosomal protein S8 [Candidatus Vidania fulgoroideae]|nr:30S ribosomal protein S8 [Candidatus Vidania fulgoroideae]